ncbi:Arm DNA-binding domain-containing protein [Nonlabens sp. YIK11]|uniref:Arm DNA-binding domain-containing protein n=1 Tax=Nonlabens sp. YIK11 TaxID=1453349 RepID=UPI001E56F2BC|nr:Arm DNA-binding domain-containing protein [Nonlabens sp. YIK11]
MKSRLAFSLLFWRETSRAKNGMAPIIARITVNRKRSNISLQRKVEIARWSKAKSRATGSSQHSTKINRFLDQFQMDIYAAFDQLVKEKAHICPQSIKARYLGQDSQEHTLLDLVEYHNGKNDRIPYTRNFKKLLYYS